MPKQKYFKITRIYIVPADDGAQALKKVIDDPREDLDAVFIREVLPEDAPKKGGWISTVKKFL